MYLCVALNDAIEVGLFAGNFPQWLYDTTGSRYDPRNSLIVGFAMGFAVIPIIYTICEDAFSNVPQHLVSGSLALGGQPLADRRPGGRADGQPGGVFGDHDRLWPGGRRNHDRADGHRQYAGHGL